MLYLQQFYGKEMQRHGYGARAFGMDIKSPGRVNIIEYKAENPASHYPTKTAADGRRPRKLKSFSRPIRTKRKASTP